MFYGRYISKLILCLCLSSMLQSCVAIASLGVGVIGVSAIQRPQIQDNINDNKIYSLINLALVKQFNKLYKKLYIQVLYGRVLLIGNIASQEDMLDILDIVWGIDGVVEVINELNIKENSNYFDSKQYFKDTYITLSIRSKLVNASHIQSLMYNVTVIDNVVYLFGIARNLEELEEVSSIAANAKGITDVKNHILMKDDLNK